MAYESKNTGDLSSISKTQTLLVVRCEEINDIEFAVLCAFGTIIEKEHLRIPLMEDNYFNQFAIEGQSSRYIVPLSGESKVQKIFIPFSVTIALAFYMIILAWSQMLVTIINGVGKVKMQMWCSILVLAIYLPLSFALGIRWGLLGIISALFFTAVPNAIVAFIQVKKILLRKAVGV